MYFLLFNQLKNKQIGKKNRNYDIEKIFISYIKCTISVSQIKYFNIIFKKKKKNSQKRINRISFPIQYIQIIHVMKNLHLLGI